MTSVTPGGGAATRSQRLLPYRNHFMRRAIAYRQLAINAGDGRTAGDMFEIAAMFNRMAEDCRALEVPSARTQNRGGLFFAIRDNIIGWTDVLVLKLATRAEPAR